MIFPNPTEDTRTPFEAFVEGCAWTFAAFVMAFCFLVTIPSCSAQQKRAVVVAIQAADGACEIVNLIGADGAPVALCLALDALEVLTRELLSAQAAGRDARLHVVFPNGEQDVTIPAHALDRALGQTQIAKAKWSK